MTACKRRMRIVAIAPAASALRLASTSARQIRQHVKNVSTSAHAVGRTCTTANHSVPRVPQRGVERGIHRCPRLLFTCLLTSSRLRAFPRPAHARSPAGIDVVLRRQHLHAAGGGAATKAALQSTKLVAAIAFPDPHAKKKRAGMDRSWRVAQGVYPTCLCCQGRLAPA